MKLKILHLEDMPADAELIERELNKSGLDYEKKVVDNKAGFIQTLKDYNPDLIISDHSLLSFNSVEALALVKELGIKVPFILVTATISEEFAAEIMKMGAYDYILKDRLQRLPNAIQNAMEKYRLEKEKQEYYDEVIANEVLFRKSEKTAKFGIWESNFVTGEVKWSDGFYGIIGYERYEIVPSLENYLKIIHLTDRMRVEKIINDAVLSLSTSILECRVKHKNGSSIYVNSILTVEGDKSGKPILVSGFLQNVTDEKKAKMERDDMMELIIHRNKNLEQFAFIVSHNLRVPVANIMGIVNTLKNNNIKKAERDEMLNGLDSSIQELDVVVRDMNQVLHLKSGAAEEKEMVSFTKLVDNIKKLNASVMEKEDVEIITNFTEVDKMKTVKSYMNSIFYNLINNSIKFKQSGKNAVIKITAHKEGGMIRIVFSDNGLGMDLTKTGNKIFGLYNRFHQHVAGKGMGLFMVKSHVEELNGTISVKSKVNEGTEFTIEFDTE